MKVKKNLSKTNKKEPEDTSPCMCRVHIELDKGRKDAIPCVGHGEGCPCTTKLAEEAKNQADKAKSETTSENQQPSSDNGNQPTPPQV